MELTINGREYTVEAIELGAELAAKGRRTYGLTGKRGAQYAVVQYVNKPDWFHVISLGFGTPSQFAGVVLTDRNGKLEVVNPAEYTVTI